MDLEIYRKALRLGRREYQQHLAKGVYPYLQVLEEITSNVELGSEVSLGVVDVPLDQIVGTNGRGRSTAFASNFMPLLDENTEFAAKWEQLCEAHLNEGIRDPIKCYEFYNRFYVVEGNKRVSVLKYFGAVSIQAEVIRLIPRPTGSRESRIYSEFLRFYKVSGVNYLYMSRLGNFDALLADLGRTKAEEWDEDFKRTFRSAFTRFKKAYIKLGGEELSTTAGDALVEYLKFFVTDGFLNSLEDTFRRRLKRIWRDIKKLEQNNPIALVEAPVEEPAHRGLANLLGPLKKPLRVAFVHDRTTGESSWTYAHEKGREQLEQLMGESIVTEAFFNALSDPDKTPEEIVGSVADSGFDVVFTTSPRLKEASLMAAASHPGVKVLNCSVNMAYRQIRTYYGRMYEAKFLAGLIAGAMTKNHTVAYVADYPISGLIANINGFARGVQLVNPEAKVYLIWSTMKEKPWWEALKECGADMVSHQDMILPGSSDRQFGLFSLADGKVTNLAQAMWNWGYFYERILRNILSGAWENEDEEDSSVNYWWGLSAGVVDLKLMTENIPEGVQQLVKVYRKVLTNRSFGPFDGYMKDQNGTVRAQNDGYIRTKDIVTMDWLNDNIIGRIPTAEELSDRAQKYIRADHL